MVDVTANASGHRRSAAGGEPVEVERKEKWCRSNRRGDDDSRQARDRRTHHGQQHLAVGKVLGYAIVIRRLVMRVDTGMSLRGNRQESHDHQRKRDHQRHSKARKGEAGLNS